MKKLFAIFALCFGAVAAAQDSIELVVYSAVGNQSDTAARFFAPSIEKALGKSVSVTNKPGASGAVGLRYADKASADNDLILVGNANITLTSLLGKLDFDPAQRFVPVYGMSFGQAAVFVSSKSDMNSAKDLVAKYKASGRLLIGSTGMLDDVTTLHLGESLGVPVEIVRYKQAAQMATELTENRIDATVATLGAGAYQSLADSGKLRAVAVVDTARNPYMPAVPTLQEQGFASVEGFRWTAFFVPASMSAATKAKISKALEAAMNSKEAQMYESLPGLPKRWLVNDVAVTAQQSVDKKVMELLLPKVTK